MKMKRSCLDGVIFVVYSCLEQCRQFSHVLFMSQLPPHNVIDGKMAETVLNLILTISKAGTGLVTLLRFNDILDLLDKLMRLLGIEMQPMFDHSFCCFGVVVDVRLWRVLQSRVNPNRLHHRILHVIGLEEKEECFKEVGLPGVRVCVGRGTSMFNVILAV